MQQSKCQSCGAFILWIRTDATGSLMPLDYEPVAGGNVAIKDGVAHVMRGDLFEAMMDGERYVSHFSTCTAAAAHRKPRERSKK